MHENLLATPVKLKFSTVMMREKKKIKISGESSGSR